MLKKVSIIVSFLLLASMSVFASETWAAELYSNGYQTSLLQGISKSFNLEKDAADANMKKAVDLEPDNPTAYAMEAMLHLFAYEMCFSLEQHKKEKEKLFPDTCRCKR